MRAPVKTARHARLRFTAYTILQHGLGVAPHSILITMHTNAMHFAAGHWPPFHDGCSEQSSCVEGGWLAHDMTRLSSNMLVVYLNMRASHRMLRRQHNCSDCRNKGLQVYCVAHLVHLRVDMHVVLANLQAAHARRRQRVVAHQWIVARRMPLLEPQGWVAGGTKRRCAGAGFLGLWAVERYNLARCLSLLKVRWRGRGCDLRRGDRRARAHRGCQLCGYPGSPGLLQCIQC